MRRLIAVLAALALAAVVVIGLAQAGEETGRPRSRRPSTSRRPSATWPARPPPLAALHEQSAAILTGGVEAFEKRLQRAARDAGGDQQVGVLVRAVPGGVPGLPAGRRRPRQDGRVPRRQRRRQAAGGRALPGRAPVPYPSYEDPDEKIARSLKAAKFYPKTIFVDARGRTAFVKAGEYTTRAELEADIDRYL